MADELRIARKPDLRKPILVCAFRGWNDGGQGATLGGGYLARQWEAEQFAEIDPEGFYDFQAVRPQVALEDGLTRKLEWPENAFYHAPIPGLDRDAVILLGVEPNLRWRTFSRLIDWMARKRTSLRRSGRRWSSSSNARKPRSTFLDGSSRSTRTMSRGPNGVGRRYSTCREAVT